MDEIKDPYVKMVIGILHATKSKTLSKWKELVSLVDVMFCFAFLYILRNSYYLKNLHILKSCCLFLKSLTFVALNFIFQILTVL